MKKAAFFVEGQTEQLFIHKLLGVMAGSKSLTIQPCQARGSNVARKREFQAFSAAGCEYFALVVDCGADNAVVSDVRDNYDFLIAQGYTYIVGLRDVFPFSRLDIPHMQRYQYRGIKTQPVCPLLVLAVMEVECWFIGEHTHFQRIDPALDCPTILAACNFDPATHDPQILDNPAAELHAIYSIVGKAYRKQKSQVQRTLDKLSYEDLWLSVAERIPALGTLIKVIDEFLG